MASYHCTVKVGGKGRAASHAAYISREGKYSGRSRYEDLESSAYGNMPKWAEHNPAHFWNAADEFERANGATYREIEVALPRELSIAQRRVLVEDFVKHEIGDKHAYQWAIHTPTAALEKGEQPHAHIIYSERTLDGLERDPEQYFKRYNGKAPEKGGCRKDSAGTEERLQATRQLWADVQNLHLERHGHGARVDHRSLREQGIDRDPEKHIGGRGVRQLQEADISALLERRAVEGELERAQKQVGLIDVSGDLAAAKAEQASQQEAVREFARQATAQFKAEMAAKEQAEGERNRLELEAQVFLGDDSHERGRRWNELVRRTEKKPVGRLQVDTQVVLAEWTASREQRGIHTDRKDALSMVECIEKYGWSSHKIFARHQEGVTECSVRIAKLEESGKRLFGRNRNVQEIAMEKSRQESLVDIGNAEIIMARDYEKFRPGFVEREHAKQMATWAGDVALRERIEPYAKAIIERDEQQHRQAEQREKAQQAEQARQPEPAPSWGRSRPRGRGQDQGR